MTTPLAATPDSRPTRNRAPASLATPDAVRRWHPATRIAFRFCVVYFGLYILTTQMLGDLLEIPGWEVPELDGLPPISDIVAWVGRVVGVAHPVVFQDTGSGDKIFDWLLVLLLMCVAAVVAGVWTLLPRRRDDQPRLTTMYAWLRLLVRFALGTTLVSYGMSKAFPLQMPFPSLVRLLTPFGTMSPEGLLWSSIGAAPAYEVFVGCAETVGGILLFLPRTTTLGALLCLADVVEVFVLNMTYDVPVKLFSFHLILLALFLLAPNLERLFGLLVLGRPATLSAEPPMGRTAHGQRVAVIAQAAFGLYIVLFGLQSKAQRWHESGGGAPRSALYGIWDVDEMSVDGRPLAPLVGDSARWRRLVFQRPGAVYLQRMSDELPARYSVSLETGNKLATMGTVLSVQRPSHALLILDGPLKGHAMHVTLRLHDLDTLSFSRRGFNWVQETPIYR